MTTSAAAALSGDSAAPAPAPATPDAGAPAAPSANEPWFKSIADNNVRTWVEAKGFQDPAAAAASAYNLEKLMGFDKAGRTLVMPGDKAAPEEIAAFRAKLGVPDKPEGYGIKAPDGVPPEFAAEASKWMHEAGIPAAAGQKLAEKWGAHMAAQMQTQEQEFMAKGEQDMAGLKTEWGAAYDQKCELARRATAQFLPAKDAAERAQMLNAIERAVGSGAMMRFFAAVGEGLGEHKVHGTNESGTQGILTPAQAAQRKAELMSNPEWSKRYLNGDKQAMNEMAALIKQQFPDGGVVISGN